MRFSLSTFQSCEKSFVICTPSHVHPFSIHWFISLCIGIILIRESCQTLRPSSWKFCYRKITSHFCHPCHLILTLFYWCHVLQKPPSGSAVLIPDICKIFWIGLFGGIDKKLSSLPVTWFDFCPPTNSDNLIASSALFCKLAFIWIVGGCKGVLHCKEMWEQLKVLIGMISCFWVNVTVT